MVTKAIILNRVINTNNYLVRIPFLDAAGMPTERRLATLSSNPAIKEEYKIDDVVYVSFEEHKANKVVIIGKLYLGESEPRGHANLESLVVSNNVSLPDSTTVGGVKMSQLIAKVNNMTSTGDSQNVGAIPVVAVVHTLLKNINDVELTNYKTEALVGSIHGYKILNLDNTKLNEQQAKDYLSVLTGTNYLPTYNANKPVYSYVFDDSYMLYRMIYDSTTGLQAIRTAKLQEELISGVTIKTINGVSLLGSGNIDIGHIVGDYLPLAGGPSSPMRGDIYFKPDDEKDEQGIIGYSNSLELDSSKLTISNLSGDVKIDSKYNPNEDAQTAGFATIIDGVPIKVLSESEVNDILYPDN